MNNRPIVLPGIATGVVLLAAMVGFVQLPKADGAAAATGHSTSALAASGTADVSMCRSVKVNHDMLGLADVVAKGDVAKITEDVNTMLGSIQQYVTDTSISATVQHPLSDYFATGVRTLRGVQSSQALGENERAQFAASWDALTKACDSVGA